MSWLEKSQRNLNWGKFWMWYLSQHGCGPAYIKIKILLQMENAKGVESKHIQFIAQSVMTNFVKNV